MLYPILHFTLTLHNSSDCFWAVPNVIFSNMGTEQMLDEALFPFPFQFSSKRDRYYHYSLNKKEKEYAKDWYIMLDREVLSSLEENLYWFVCCMIDIC